MAQDQNFNRREIEGAIIGWLVGDDAQTSASRDALSQLAPDNFSDPAWRRVFEVIKQHVAEGTGVDAITIADEIGVAVSEKEIMGEVLKLGSGLVEMHLPPLVESLKKHVRREKLEAFGKSVSGLLDAGKDDSEIIASLQTRLNDISTGTKSRIRNAMQARREQIRDFEAMRAGTYVAPPRLSLGVSAIDDALKGGIANGQLALFAARPACGKTSFAVSVIANALRSGKKVLFASLEMTDREIVNKMTGSLTGIYSPETQEEWNLLEARGISTDDMFNPGAFGDYARRLFFIDKSPYEEFFQTVKLEFRRERFDVFVLDYAQLLGQGGPQGECLREAVSKVSVGLKTLARELEIPVLALAQLNRDSSKESRKPRITDIKESGSLEQDADVVFLLSDDSDPNAQDVKHASKETRLVEIAKNRHGGTGCFKLSFNAYTSRFTERNDSDA